METLAPPEIESIQPENNVEVHVDGMAVAYRQNAGARRTEYAGDTSAAIDGGELGAENNLGSFEVGDISLPVVAKFTVENKPQSYAIDAAPESEFLVVDIRDLGLADNLGSSVSGFKTAVDTAQHFGKANHADDAPQFALVNLTGIQRRSREGGSLFSISTISRDPENPTVIRRDNTLHGEATVDSLSALGIGESNVTVASDENGKIIVSMAQESNDSVQVDTTSELLDQYEPQYAQSEQDSIKAERRHRQNKMLGGAAMRGVFTDETFNHYKAAYDQIDNDTNFWTRTTTSDFDRPINNDTYEFRDPTTDVKATGATSTSEGPLRTPEDVQRRIADMRKANMPDKVIKRTILRDVHPDSNPDVDPRLAQAVTNEFHRVQEYRNQGSGSTTETVVTSQSAASNSEEKATTTPTSSTEVVSTSAPTQSNSSDFTQAA